MQILAMSRVGFSFLTLLVVLLSGFSEDAHAGGAVQNPAPQNGQTVIQQPGGPLLFDPAHQRAIAYGDKEISVRLIIRGQKLGVLAKRKGATERSIALPEEMAQVNEIRRAQGDKVVVLGMLNGDAWVFAVVDLETYQVTDTVWCYSPAVSPDGHYVAFIKFFPTHLPLGANQTGVDYHYLLYNLTVNRSQNLPRGDAGTSNRVDVGICVYPPRIGNAEGDNTNTPPENAHVLASETFFWRTDSKAYVFADMYQGKLDLVMVRLQAGGPSSSVLEVPVQQLCTSLHKAKCEARLEAVQFLNTPSESVLTSFRGVGVDGSLRQTLQFELDQFHDAR